MNITLTSLEALILKATSESLPCPDPAALEAFCAVMRDSPEGPQLAAQALAARIHASNAREALLGLSMLDRCMRRGDVNFQAEVGKFRFLNEMIKLVSPKYFADRTAPEVRTRVLQLFHAWSIEYPKESKFKVAYDMLRNQGVIRETPPPLPLEDSTPRARAKSAIFEDEEKSKLLQKLLQSKKPEDLQHANRLIKTMVKEEERRSEASSRRAAETGAALDSAELLRDMLAHAAHASPDELQLIHELHASCLRLRPALQRLAASDAGDCLDDILHASDVLDEVFEVYNVFVNENKEGTQIAAAPSTNGDRLLDFATGDRGEGDATRATAQRNALDELGDIFATGDVATAAVEPLKPVNLMTQDDTDLLGEGRTEKAEGWLELDSLGQQLLRQSLPEHARRPSSFTSKSSKKIPMNALDKISPNDEAKKTNDSLLDLDFFSIRPKPKGAISQQAQIAFSDVKPKRPMSAYMLWLNSAREQIKADHPGLRVTEVAKKGGEIWRAMRESEKSLWEQKAAAAKEQYERDLEIYGRQQGTSQQDSQQTVNKTRSLLQLDDQTEIDKVFEQNIPAEEQSSKDLAMNGAAGASQPPSNQSSNNGSPSDTMLDISMPAENTTAIEDDQQNTASSGPLDDIRVSLARVTPSCAPPLPLFAARVTVTLRGCRDRPRPGVSVLVITAVNNGPSPVDDYKFTAVVPKPPQGCKVRLQEPSATTLPPHNPFAPVALTQVMLVSRPTASATVPLKCAITYVCDDDMHSEVKEFVLPADVL